MPIKTYKPTSPSRRALTVVDYRALSGARRHKPLTKRLKAHSGRNVSGRITMRHQGGGNRRIFRVVDFRMEKMNVSGRVLTIEYDPYRTAFIALIGYADGEKRYLLAPNGLKVGDRIVASPDAPLTMGNRTILKRIPVGAFIHNVEFMPGGGGQLARSAGAQLQVLAQEDGYTHLKMGSGEIRKVSWNCYASIGQVSNQDHNLVVIGKAGRSRWLGVRPTVRGKVMNPRDHPYGGGEGRTQRGTRRPKTKWGKITGGHKTRNRKKWSSALILQRRKHSH
jgi:large subunit ribosomal protein L2